VCVCVCVLRGTDDFPLYIIVFELLKETQITVHCHGMSAHQIPAALV